MKIKENARHTLNRTKSLVWAWWEGLGTGIEGRVLGHGRNSEALEEKRWECSRVEWWENRKKWETLREITELPCILLLWLFFTSHIQNSQKIYKQRIWVPLNQEEKRISCKCVLQVSRSRLKSWDSPIFFVWNR